MRGQDEPSLLDLVFTRTNDEALEMSYLPPMGKSDHAVMRFDFIVQYDIDKSKETSKESSCNVAKGTYSDLNKYVQESTWKQELNGKDIHTMYRRLCEVLQDELYYVEI